MVQDIPVITIDGPSGSGKGTISQLLAEHLNWHFLDSGSLYRILALAAKKQTIAFTDEARLADIAQHLNVKFITNNRGAAPQILLEDADVTDIIRTEECGNNASAISALKNVRLALIERQRTFKQAPGLVTDGRDMGTIIFPEAQLKLFLEASLDERATRRFKQLQSKGMIADYSDVKNELLQRDERDKNRAIAPLKPADDAIIIDTTGLTIEDVFNKILPLIHDRQLA